MITLEKAARALAASWYLDEAAADNEWRSGYEHLDDYVNSTWDEWVPQARAVLMAVFANLTRYKAESEAAIEDDYADSDGYWVRYADLQAILAETPDQD